ncbi:MAG TPA: hypothetical protein VGI45_02430 [Terracidiphilus sp.]
MIAENDEEALRLYQPFKFAVIAALPQESNCVLTEADLDAELDRLRSKTLVVTPN